MAQDSKDYVRRCDKCQRYSSTINRLGEMQTPMLSPWPFAQGGIKVVRSLTLARGHLKVVVIVADYFTQWVEAELLATITERKMKSFIERNILSRFGIPRVLVSDNGRQFDTPVFR